MSLEESMSSSPGKEPRKQSMLYEICPHCEGKSCKLCKTIGVVETGATEGQLRYLAQLDTLRQEAGITAAMLRDGRARAMMEAFRSKNP